LRTPLLLTLLLVAGAPACASSPFDRDHVSKDLGARRPAASLRPAHLAGTTDQRLPPGTTTADGLSEDEAVAIALWNNPRFQADLASLGLARADLLEAGMIRNPLLTLLLPLGPKQLELTGSLPIQDLWQRPRRVKAAGLEVERVASSLVQSGLDLVRDSKRAYADAQLAVRREALADEALDLRRRIARITEARLAAGDISRAEAAVSQVEAETAALDRQRLAEERRAAEDRLGLLLGLTGGAPVLSTAQPQPRPLDHGDALLKQALAARPDLRAAELVIEAQAARLGWEKSKLLGQVSGIVDLNGSGKQGLEVGPGFSLEIPLFNQNRGGMARARAELERAAWNYAAVRQQIAVEVRSAQRLYQLAADSLAALRGRVLPAVGQTVAQAERAFAEGEGSRLFVLEAARQMIDARLREAELEAALRRAAAELDRSVGRKIVDAP
jgi:cobalt-zinc-cadmium efflux system outer membrane protein